MRDRAKQNTKLGAKGDQKNNPVSLTETKSITKSLHSAPQPKDSYHLLTKSQQVIIFRLKSGHNRLNKHLYKKCVLCHLPCVLVETPNKTLLMYWTSAETTSCWGKRFGRYRRPYKASCMAHGPGGHWTPSSVPNILFQVLVSKCKKAIDKKKKKTPPGAIMVLPTLPGYGPSGFWS